MSLIESSEIREVTQITPEERQRIIDFLQGAVYSWCKNRKEEWFSMRDLMGGDNHHWAGTPLMVLYEKHIKMEKDEESAVDGAGKDSGWLLKRVIEDDKRSFDTKKEEQIRKYKWVE